MIKIKRLSESGIRKINIADGEKKMKLNLKHHALEFNVAAFST